MPKKSSNGNPLTTNILQLMNQLKEKGMLADLKKDLTERYKAAPGNKKMFRVFNQMLEKNDSALEPSQSDEDLAKEVGLDTNSFNDKKQDFYDRILDYVVRKTAEKEKWENKALKLVDEVDALWDLGLRTHAEARFLKLQKLCAENVTDEESKWRYTYLLSKIRYYAYSFKGLNHLGKREKYEGLLSKEQFALISDIESASQHIDANARRYAEPEKWKQESIEFKVFQVLALLAKQKRNYREARAFTRNELEKFAQAKMQALFSFNSKGDRFFEFYDNYSPTQVQGIVTAFYYYLKIEEYHLALLDNDTHSAEYILSELYTILNETSEKSQHYLTGLLLYLQLDLQQAQFALMLKGWQPKEQRLSFAKSFLATSQEVVNMEARMEINSLWIQFFSMPEKPDLTAYKLAVKTLEGKLKVKALASIKLELNLLQLLIFLEGIAEEGKDEYIKLATKYAKESDRGTALLDGFLKGIRKIRFTDYTHLKNELPKLADALEKLRNPKMHIDNIIMCWLNKYPVVRKSKP